MKRTFWHYFFLPIRVVYKIYIFLCFSIFLLLFYPVLYYYLKDSRRLKKAFKIIKVYSFIFHVIAGIPPLVRGKKNIPPKGSYLVCFNHQSFLDITNAYNVLPDYFVFVGKKELKKWPLFQIFFLSEMNILVDRQSKIGSYKSFLQMAEQLGKGNPVALFPEGTMSKKAPEMNPFKSGAFVVAIQKQVPIIPVTYLTHWKRIENGGFWHGYVSPGFCKVIIHEPVQTTGLTKEDVDTLSEKIWEIINKPLSDKFKNR